MKLFEKYDFEFWILEGARIAVSFFFFQFPKTFRYRAEGYMGAGAAISLEGTVTRHCLRLSPSQRLTARDS